MAVEIKDLMEAGAHFGHKVARRHPAFSPFLYGERKGVHIINSAYTLVQLEESKEFLRDVVAGGGRVLFVGTKPQAQESVKHYAEEAGQFYVVFRWLGGFLTNFKTIRNSIKKMIAYEDGTASEGLALTKKERQMREVEYQKLTRVLEGVRDMRKAPAAVVIVDVGHESIAVHECNVLGVPVVGICDSNCDPTKVTHPIPGNDDSVRAINLYLEELVAAIKEGEALHNERAAAADDEPVQETEFVLDKEEDLDEAALLDRRKVYKVKKTIKLKEETQEEPEGEEAEKPVEDQTEESSEGAEKPAEKAASDDSAKTEAGTEEQASEEPAEEKEA